MALVAVADAGNEAEAVMIVARLRESGIPAMSKPSAPRGLPQFGAAATQTVYVDAKYEARAREALEDPEFSDEELAELAEEAGREQGGPPPD